jgi:hypothetical protein
MKIWKPEKGETNAWSSFTSKYDQDTVLHNTTLENFKQHMRNHWTQNGSPGDTNDMTQKALYTLRDTRASIQKQQNMKLTCEACQGQGHTENNCWKSEKNAHKRPEWWKEYDKEKVFSGKCFRCGETGHKGYQCKKNPDVAMSASSEKEEIALTVTEVKNRDFYYDHEWAKNPQAWYERTQRRGPYYGEKYKSFDGYYAKSDDEDKTDETFDEYDDVAGLAEGKKVYDLRKIPMKVEDKNAMERDYYKNHLFYDLEDSGNETEADNRSDISSDSKARVDERGHQAGVMWKCEEV